MAGPQKTTGSEETRTPFEWFAAKAQTLHDGF
jgi:hypothetical protein